jgi:periplasmic protein TonB
MFDNLVESGSHKDDLSRKGSFLMGAAAIYLVLGVAFFIVGIYTYNDYLEAEEFDVTLVAPVPVPVQQKEPEQKKEETKPVKEQNVDVRKELIASVNQTTLVPQKVETKASNIPPVRQGVTTVVGTTNVNAAAPLSSASSGTTTVVQPKVEVAEPPPPEAPKPTPPRAPISGGVLNGKAINLVHPQFPAIAKQAHACGTVTVQAVIDEAGNVISAHAAGGHPLLQASAVAAARASKFSPTKLSGQPVKVTGVITYNFVCQ